MTHIENLVRKKLLKSGEVFDMPLTREAELKVLKKFAKRKQKKITQPNNGTIKKTKSKVLRSAI